MTKSDIRTHVQKHITQGKQVISKRQNIKTDKKATSSSRRDYKKSISTSLVYRSLKVGNAGYVGFKVTYSGKGGHGNYDRSRLSIILIPDISVVRGYRPIAGAIARATRGEVITCSYTGCGGQNDRLIDLIINRSKYMKSKLRWIDVISQNDEILETFKQRLSMVDKLSAAMDAVHIETPEGEKVDLSFQDAPASPLAVPLHVNVKANVVKKRRVQLIKISTKREKSAVDGKGLVSRVMSRVFGKLGRIFSGSPEPQQKQELTESVFAIHEKAYKVDEKLSFTNPHHCDLIAKDMFKQ